MSDRLSDLEKIASQILDQRSEHRRALTILLDEVLATSNRILVQRTEMGGSVAYIGSVTLEWFSEKVRFASALSLFVQKMKVDEKTRNVIIDVETIEEIQQRPLDWSRQALLAQYLATHRNHKFPPVLVGINKPWVDNLNADEWDKDRKAVRLVADFMPLDSDGKIGLLDISDDVTLFALDGQHRLMGVIGLMELIRTGMLNRFDRNKKLIGSAIKSEELIQNFKKTHSYLTHSYLQGLAKEKIGIEFIPTVVPGETREDARRRVRSIFVDVNKMATSLTKGQLAALEEQDGFAIIARRAGISHELLMAKDSRPPRVNWNKSSLSTKSEELTTLQTLKQMAKLYLIHKYSHWEGEEEGLVPMRPSEVELDEGLNEFKLFLDHVGKLPSFKAIEQGAKPGEYRRLSKEKVGGKGGQGHMLFRPVGQAVLAQALGSLVYERHLSLDSLTIKLQKYEKDGGFNMESEKSIFYSVLYDPNRRKILISGTSLAVRLLEYLLGGGEQDEVRRKNLHELLVKARTYEKEATNFNGKREKNPSDVDLPPTL